MRTTYVGLFFGALLGLALVLTNFGDMLGVALFGIVGWAIARVLEGDVDLNDWLSQRRRGNSGR